MSRLDLWDEFPESEAPEGDQMEADTATGDSFGNVRFAGAGETESRGDGFARAET